LELEEVVIAIGLVIDYGELVKVALRKKGW
jgi:hypothetical protein